jgi:hypothetical protein
LAKSEHSDDVGERTKEANAIKKLRNHELVVLAVYLVGGDAKDVDTEDIAIKVNILAPGRFTWRKYPDQINIEIVRTFLSDAKKEKNGSLLSGRGSTGWSLTEAGLRFVKENLHSVSTPAQRVERLDPKELRRRKSEQSRVVVSEAYVKFASGKSGEITRQEADAVFRLNSYITGEARIRKVQRMVNALGDDDKVGEALSLIAGLVLKETK